jgi:DNA-binding MltR family transcriptional regulator
MNESSKDKPLVKADQVKDSNLLQSLLSQQPQRPDKNQSRVDALIGVATIDVALQGLLSKALTPSLQDNLDELLSEGQALGSLLSRAKLACRMGLISHDLYSTISKLSKIRNASAHDEQRVNIFDKDDVRQIVSNIWDRITPKFKSEDDKTIEEKFNSICFLVKISITIKTDSIRVVTYGDKEIMFI